MISFSVSRFSLIKSVPAFCVEKKLLWLLHAVCCSSPSLCLSGSFLASANLPLFPTPSVNLNKLWQRLFWTGVVRCRRKAQEIACLTVPLHSVIWRRTHIGWGGKIVTACRVKPYRKRFFNILFFFAYNVWIVSKPLRLDTLGFNRKRWIYLLMGHCDCGCYLLRTIFSDEICR